MINGTERKQAQKQVKKGTVKDTRGANTSINWTIGHKKFMLHEASPHLWNIPVKPMTVIKFLVFMIACGVIEPRFFSCFSSRFL